MLKGSGSLASAAGYISGKIMPTKHNDYANDQELQQQLLGKLPRNREVSSPIINNDAITSPKITSKKVFIENNVINKSPAIG